MRGTGEERDANTEPSHNLMHNSIDENNKESNTNNNNNNNNNNEEEDYISVLLCSHCRAPITQYEDIIPTRANNTWMSHVYAYELDIFSENKPIWCYSATNPSARRFDLIRCDANIATNDNNVILSGGWSSEHSFFIEHEWCYCHCVICQHFLGWGFRPIATARNSKLNKELKSNKDKGGDNNNDDDNNNNIKDDNDDKGQGDNEENNDDKDKDKDKGVFDITGLSFIGLILTHCVGDDKYTRTKYKERKNYLAQENIREESELSPSVGLFLDMLRREITGNVEGGNTQVSILKESVIAENTNLEDNDNDNNEDDHYNNNNNDIEEEYYVHHDEDDDPDNYPSPWGSDYGGS